MEESKEHQFLYEEVANKLQQLIKTNVLKNGDKLLSVRSLSKEYGISISTAFKAYAELEIMGFVEARPKSGFYVNYHPRKRPPHTPQTAFDVDDPKEVNFENHLSAFYNNIRTYFLKDDVNRLFTSSCPTELFPKDKLRNIVSGIFEEQSGNHLGYEDIQGNSKLRRQIARYAFNHGTVVTEDDIITTHGCTEALAFCLRAVTKPYDVVAVDCPGYWGIYSILQELNLKVLEIPVDHTHSIDLEALENAIRKADVKACLFMPNFSTPTGALMSDDKKNTLVKMLSAKNLPLIEDDVMGDIYFSKLRPRTCKSFDTRGNVMLCSSFSKTLGPGFRVGWCIPGKYKEEIVKVKKSHSLSSTTVMHSAIATFLEKGRFDLHMRKLRQAFQSNMLKYRDAILKYFPEDIGITLPHGGNSLWIQLNEKLDAFKLHHEAIKTGFCLIPGHVSNQNGRYTNYIRISYSMMYNQTIEKGLKTLGELVKSMAT